MMDNLLRLIHHYYPIVDETIPLTDLPDYLHGEDPEFVSLLQLSADLVIYPWQHG